MEKKTKYAIIGVILLAVIVIAFWPSDNSGYVPPPDEYSYTFSGADDGWYDITFPDTIWIRNSQIANDDSVENFLTVGGVWNYVDWIFYHDESDGGHWYSWNRTMHDTAPWFNDLTNIEPNLNYQFHVNEDCVIRFEYE